MRSFLKNERGLTLVELLAAIIIFSILLLIAVPMVSTMIENSRKDAYLADAEMLVYAAKLAEVNGEARKTYNKGKAWRDARKFKEGVVGGSGGFSGGTYYTIAGLMELGYLRSIKNEYEYERSVVVCYNGTYSVRLFLNNPYNHQVIPKKGEKRETPLVADQKNSYEVNRSVAFNGPGGRDTVANIEDVRGKRNLVNLP